MKRLITLAMIMAMTASFFGCKKDSTNDTTTTPSFTMKYEGTAWTGATYTAVHLSANNSTAITAYRNGYSDQVVVSFTGSATGTYSFDNDVSIGSGTIGSTTFSTLFADPPTGSIVITRYDTDKKLVSGTFYFTASTFAGVAIHITEGKFENIPLTVN